MSTSRDRVEDTYESQNDQRLDELHSKIRTLRGVTTDIHDDVERQNLMLDDTGDRFNSFGASLAQSTRRAGQAFGIGEGAGGLKIWRIVIFIVGAFISFWLVRKIFSFWHSDSTV
ncbi:hypothetical protein C8R46DRAFT_989041 [Mycena filopes]|nr:hypothetical protein C8R46DRAFT_1009781 [Mycena filopes]KAJ7176843.1 hypothetical protein C8R46DRAFT_989041 [Mycena filopes]